MQKQAKKEFDVVTSCPASSRRYNYCVYFPLRHNNSHFLIKYSKCMFTTPTRIVNKSCFKSA